MFLVIIEKDNGGRETCVNADAILAIRELPRQPADSPFEGAVIEMVNGKVIHPTDGYRSILGQLEDLDLKWKPKSQGGATVTPLRI